jgi:hypothetical protein
VAKKKILGEGEVLHTSAKFLSAYPGWSDKAGAGVVPGGVPSLALPPCVAH